MWEAGPGGAGAVWDIWRAQDVDLLRGYLRELVPEFVDKGLHVKSCEVRGEGKMDDQQPVLQTFYTAPCLGCKH
jgi:hypothetical protein